MYINIQTSSYTNLYIPYQYIDKVAYLKYIRNNCV